MYQCHGSSSMYYSLQCTYQELSERRMYFGRRPPADPDSRIGGQTSPHFHSPTLPYPLPFLSLPVPVFPSLPLEVGPLNTARGSGRAL